MEWEELLEREMLRLLPPGQVYETLSSLKKPTFLDENLPETTIAVLLERNEPLVDLALARFCSGKDTTAKLFAKGGAFRVAVLANRNAWGPLRRPALEEGTLAEVLREGPYEGAQVFLTNPSVPSTLLEAAVAGKGLGQGLPDERRMSVVRCLAENPAFKTTPDEGDTCSEFTWSEFTRARYAAAPIQAMWNLLWDVPPTRAWASTLWDSLCRIGFSPQMRDNFVPDLTTEDGRKEWQATSSARWEAFKRAFVDMLAVRWATPSQEDGNARSVDPFSGLRQTVAAKMAEATQYDKEILVKLRDHDDQAIRLGYYSGFPVDSDTDLGPFWERDRNAFVEAMVENTSLYRIANWKVQDAFSQVLSQADPSDVIWERWRDMKEHWREKDPANYGDEPTKEMEEAERRLEEDRERGIKHRREALERAQAERLARQSSTKNAAWKQKVWKVLGWATAIGTAVWWLASR